jgi:hypothetical protein
MADDGIGVTGAICLVLGGVLGGKLLSRWETKLDRHVVCEELDKFTGELASHCETAEDHRELMEIKRGVDQVRRGNIPFDDSDGFVSGLWQNAKTLGGKLNPAKLWRRGGKPTNGEVAQVEIKTPTAPAEA